MSGLPDIFVVFFGSWLRFFLVFSLIRPFRQIVPGSVRAILALAIAVAATPLKVEPIAFPMAYLGLEIVLGLTVAALVAFVAEMLPISGRLVDTFRGAQFAEQLLPGASQQSTLLENMAMLLTCSLILAADIYQPFIRGLSLIDQQTIFAENYLDALIVVGQLTISSALLIAAPILIVCLTLDCATAVLSRGISRSNMSFEFLPLKLLCGLIALSLYLPSATQSTQEFWDNELAALFRFIIE